MANRTVTIKSEPTRVVSLAPSITEDLYYLGLFNRLVGVTKYADFPPQVRNVSKVGGYGAYASLEKIAALKPDLIIADNAVFWKKGFLQDLEKIAPVIIVDPTSLSQIPNAIYLLGKVFNRQQKAVEVVDEFKAELSAIHSLVANRTRVEVFYVVWNKPLMTVGKESFINGIIDIAGGVNVFGNLSKAYPTVSLEEVIVKDPDVIILTPHCGMTIEEAYSMFKDTKAAKMGQIYMIEDEGALVHPSPRVVNGTEIMARLLHPDAFRTKYPLTVRDMANRTVMIPREPRRIVSLAPSVTETLFYIGAGSELVGVTKYADWPPAVANISRVGGYGAYASLEKIAALKPDLIIADNAVLWKKGFLQDLEKIAPVIIVDPKSIDGIYEQVKLLGKVTNREEQATLVVAEMKARIRYVEQEVANASRPKVMFLLSAYKGYLVAGGNTFADSMIRIAGGVNVFHNLTGWKAVTASEIVKANPEVVIVMPYVNTSIFCHEPLSSIDAAKKGHVYAVSNSDIFQRPSPRIVEAIVELAEYLHPNIFKFHTHPLVCSVAGG